MTLSITTLCIKCHWAECRELLVVILTAFMLGVVMLNVIVLSVVVPLQNTIKWQNKNVYCLAKRASLLHSALNLWKKILLVEMMT
jgi:hypothetical protein